MTGSGAKAVAAELRDLQANVLPATAQEQLRGMLDDDLRARLRAANQRESEAWAKVQSQADWERFRERRMEALRRSLGTFPPAPESLDVEVTGTFQGEGFNIQNLVFGTRPGLVATANLYIPDPPREKMPGILICHSHHNPKTQGELQDMGMTWARLGAMVLLMDQVGHGERRQQPFGGREDYHSRYILGMQLHLAGESLISWMVWDLMRGVDLLLSRDGIDPDKIILIGAVAGGGDPGAVVAALDERVKCSVPFNFGGPQPETRYPLPSDAEVRFNYAGTGSWESTRNLRLSAHDGFLPWVIVAAAAPRYLSYAHEFAWDKERDPVWKRLQEIYGFYHAKDNLSFVLGWGNVKLQPPAASHCNNVGAPHRKMIYPAFERWFGMPAPEEEYQHRLEPEQLSCMTPEVEKKFQPKMVHQLAADLGSKRAADYGASLAKLAPADRRKKLREGWARLLGDVEPEATPAVKSAEKRSVGKISVEKIVLQVEERIVVPVLLLSPGEKHMPVVVALAQQGKEHLLKERAEEVARLLEAGVGVCLPDVRGSGETRPGDEHGWHSEGNPSTRISSTELMLGQTLLGSELRDLRSVLSYLRERADVDASRIGLWGDSLASVNPENFEDPPLRTDNPPSQSEPMGALLTLLGALFEEDVKALVARRGLVGFASVLSAPFCYIPHDIIVPGALEVGDVCDLAGALAPRPLRLEGLVDGRNRIATEKELDSWLKPTRQAYAEQSESLVITPELSDETAAWLVHALRE